MRRVARENVFKLVFEYTFYGSVNESTLELMLVDSDLTEDDISTRRIWAFVPTTKNSRAS